jgi:hypothetical protein
MKSRLAFCAALFAASAAHAAVSVAVDAGAFDRRETVVSFKLPPGVKTVSVLKSDAETSPVQADADGNAWFIIRDLKRGAGRTYTFENAAVRERVSAEQAKGELQLSVSGKRAFTYNVAKTAFPSGRTDLKPVFHRAGYIHPVFTPGGALVTDDYPANHKHHHGIWLSWSHAIFEGRTNDYWNMGAGVGTMEFVGLDSVWSGPVHAGFTSRHQHIDLTAKPPKAALNETWNVRLFAAGSEAAKPCFIFDVEVTDTCATAAPVKLPQYRYGGICVRGNWAWNGRGKSSILTSEGETDAARGDRNQVHARWVHLGGMVDGKPAGIAALAHPGNFRFPEPVRLNPAEPYFNFAPQQAGNMEIIPGKPFVARYRWIAADDKPDAAELDRLWNDYAHPPVVTVRH